MSKNDADITGFKFYRIAYSHEDDHRGWCVYEQKDQKLFLVDGPWKEEQKARDRMRQLNQEQGLQLNGGED